MLPDYSPFTPGSPVPIELFVGRENELRRLSDHLNAASKGIPRIAFLSGERGIGKSSIAAYIKHFAERRHSMAAVQVLLGGADTVSQLVQRVFTSVLEECVSKKWSEKVKSLFGKSVHSLDFFGIKLQFTPEPKQLEGLQAHFAKALHQLITQLKADSQATGLLLILDNINGIAESKEFADWFKILVDQIATQYHPMPICILLVGVKERRASLARLNPSLARVFDLIDINPWSDGETKTFFQEAFGSVGHRIAPEALNLLSRYTGGIPAVAHEIGDAVFKVNTDKMVDRMDAIRGIISAALVIGEKHIHEKVVKAVRSKKYQAILRKIVGSSDLNNLSLERKSLLAMVPESEHQLVSNFIQRMKKLGVLLDDSGRERGFYRFSSHILSVYLYLVYGPETQRAS